MRSMDYATSAKERSDHGGNVTKTGWAGGAPKCLSVWNETYRLSWRYVVVTADNGAMVPCRCFLRQADLTVDVVAVAVVRKFCQPFCVARCLRALLLQL